MRPINRPNPPAPSYFTNSTALAGQSNAGMGQHEGVRKLGLCLNWEIYRLSRIIRAAAVAAGGLAAAALPFPPALIPIPVPAPITAAPAIAGSNIIRNYERYNRISASIQYNVNANTWGGGGQYMLVGDYPYAISAMRDVMHQIGAAGAGAKIYSFAPAPGPHTAIALPPLPATLRSYTGGNILSGLRHFYTAMNRASIAPPLPYRDASTELINRLGPYCAYCEANLKAMIHVEHMLPKASHPNTFPSFSKYWENFLPACPTCNSYKSSHPTKIDITTRANGNPFVKDDTTLLPPVGTIAGGTIAAYPQSQFDERITDLEYKRLLEDHYQFPLEATSYQNVGFRLNEITGTPTAPIRTPVTSAISAQVGWSIQSVNENEKEVIVNTPQFTSPATGVASPVSRFEVYLDIVPRVGVGGTALLPTPLGALSKVQAMGAICRLNDTSSNTDRRVVERTEAWFMALEAVNKIEQRLQGFSGGTPATIYNDFYELWRDNTIRIIKEKGFLSVWLKIFTQFAHPLTGTPGANPTFPVAPAVGGVFIPMIGGAATGAPGAAVPVRGAAIGNLAQDIAQTILQTGAGVNDAAQNAAGVSLGIPAPAAPAVIPMAGAAGVGLVATWAGAGAGAIALAEAAARKAGAAYSRYFPNTNWDQVP